MKSSLPLTVFFLAFSLALPAIASVKPVQGGETRGTQVLSLRFRIPNIRPSGNLRGGAARGGCNPEGKDIALMPLLPLNEPVKTAGDRNNIKVYPAKTVSPRPTFFVYIPEISAREANFLLLEKINETTDEPIYETTVALTGTPGILSFTVPADAPSLEIGKTYKWSVEVFCDSEDTTGGRSGNPAVQGVVERVALPAELANAETAPPSELPALYVGADLWYDALASLAQLRYLNPNDPKLVSDWNELLQSVNLDTIADAPLVQCCTAQKQ